MGRPRRFLVSTFTRSTWLDVYFLWPSGSSGSTMTPSSDLSVDLASFLVPDPGRDLLFCKSPVNPRGGWTWMSAGQFFIRRTPAMAAFLDAVLTTDLEVVEGLVDPERPAFSRTAIRTRWSTSYCGTGVGGLTLGNSIRGRPSMRARITTRSGWMSTSSATLPFPVVNPRRISSRTSRREWRRRRHLSIAPCSSRTRRPWSVLRWARGSASPSLNGRPPDLQRRPRHGRRVSRPGHGGTFVVRFGESSAPRVRYSRSSGATRNRGNPGDQRGRPLTRHGHALADPPLEVRVRERAPDRVHDVVC